MLDRDPIAAFRRLRINPGCTQRAGNTRLLGEHNRAHFHHPNLAATNAFMSCSDFVPFSATSDEGDGSDLIDERRSGGPAEIRSLVWDLARTHPREAWPVGTGADHFWYDTGKADALEV
jgi:hypothetical protein